MATVSFPAVRRSRFQPVGMYALKKRGLCPQRLEVVAHAIGRLAHDRTVARALAGAPDAHLRRHDQCGNVAWIDISLDGPRLNAALECLGVALPPERVLRIDAGVESHV